MSIETFSIFYFLDEDIDSTNQNINFDEGGPELTAVLTPGSYSHEDLADQMKIAFDAAGALTYTVTFNRADQTYTIAATGTFALLVSTGSQVGTGPFTLIGFTGADRTGASTYTGNTTAGSVYEPQFLLQNFVDEDDNQQKIDPSVNESSDGIVEVVSFGTRQIYELSIRFATDRDVTKSGQIKNNATGVADLRTFMQRIIDKSPFEFMKNIAARTTFDKVILESTPEDSKGTAYRLKEMSLNGGPTGFFGTGLLRLRVIT